MTTINAFLIILLLEIVVLVLAFAIFIGERAFGFLKERKKKRYFERFSSLIVKALQTHQKKIQIRSGVKNLSLFIALLSSFDAKFQGGKWEELKGELASEHLLPKARKWAKSFFWKKRYLAGKIFSLSSQPRDKKTIIKLVHDRSFLVQAASAYALVRMDDRSCLEILLKKMSGSSAYARVYFRDIILQGSTKTFLHVEKILDKSSSEVLRIACFDILSAKNMPVKSKKVQTDASSKNADLRLACIKLHAHNPQEYSERVLCKAIHDKEAVIRREASYGLQHFSSKTSQAALENTISDQDWLVRLQAAKSLKEIGSEGIKVLKRHLRSKSNLSRQLAGYVLQLSAE